MLVLTRAGYRPISELVAYEDRVWARDDATGREDWRAVEARTSSYHDAVMVLVIRDADGDD